jgi:hypothetical protein
MMIKQSEGSEDKLPSLFVWLLLIEEERDMEKRSYRSAAMRGLLVSLTALASLSCAKSDRKPVFPVAGRVLMDGKPLGHAFVVFHPRGITGPDDVPPRALADGNGNFFLSTYDGADGAPAGEYRITVEKYKAATETDNGRPVNLVPARYAKPDTSHLTVRVHEGRNELSPFQLKR